jgi:signal peptide peptidase SppA
MKDLKDKLAAALAARPLEPLWAIAPAHFELMQQQMRQTDVLGHEAAIRSAAADAPGYTVSGGVAVIPIHGIIQKSASIWTLLFGGRTTVELQRDIAAALADPTVEAIVLHVDSPGGTVAGTSELADAILAARTVKPLHAFVSDTCASAAYWLASQASRITADADASVGSIGVFMAVADYSAQAAQMGVKVHVVASSPLKGAGTEGTEITPEQLEEWQAQVDGIYGVFVDAVARGRGWTRERALAAADARVHVGAAAVDAGLIDAIGSFDEAVAFIRQNTGGAGRSGVAGANGGQVPDGTQIAGGADMDEKMRAFLIGQGLPADADEAATAAFIDKFTAQSRTQAAQATVTTNVVQDVQAAQEAAVKAERERVRAIGVLAGRHPALDAAWAQEMVAGGHTLENARAAALDRIAAASQPVKTSDQATPGLRVGEDRNLATIGPAITDALLMRSGVRLYQFDAVNGRPVMGDDGRPMTRKPHDRAVRMQHASIVALGQMYLDAVGVPDARLLPASQVARLLMSRRAILDFAPQASVGAMSTSDFDYILGDVMGKSLRAAYIDAPSTWQQWAQRGIAPDFKSVKLVGLSESPNLSSMAEGKEIDYVQLGENRETVALVRYGGGIALTYEAIVNDDLGAFGRIPMLQANAAKRKEDDVCYAILTANGNLNDGVALFATAATRANLASSGGAISVTTLGAGQAAMMVQKGPKAAGILGIIPSYLIVPAAKAVLAQQVVGSTVDPSKNNATMNPFQNKLTVVVEARLDGTSTTNWYLAADGSRIDTVRVMFLAGAEMPQLTQETEFSSDAKKFKVTHSVAAKAVDFRGLYSNTGA